MSEVVGPGPESTRVVARVVWAALALGPVLFGGFLGSLNRQPKTPVLDPELLLMISGAMALTMAPLGLFLRGQIFKRHWKGSIVTPEGYIAGCLVAWACCEGVAFTALMFVLISGSWLPAGPGVAAWTLHLLLWPNGRAMFNPDES